ncbi:LigA [Nocardioidaceae bacterium Broad-1]|nr:LigA [Nocardioidaceae bacterium Broad-1]
MRLLTVPEPGVLREVTVPDPVAGPGQIRIRVACVGVCGSDVEVFTGRRPPKLVHGHPVLGHEVSGVVDQIGEGVTGIKIGDRATCVEGWGALADYLVSTPQNTLVFDDRIPLADGCLLEVLPGVAMAAWDSGVTRGSDVLVIGQGLSGLLITALTAIHGCRRLVVVDPIPTKTALAAEFGATDVWTGRLQERAAAIAAAYPDGFDLSIVATRECVVNELVPLMRPRSRVVAFGGLEEASIDVMALHRRSVSLIKEGEMVNGVRQARARWHEALRLVADGLVPLSRLRTHDLPMAEAETALALRSGPGADPEEVAIHVVLHNEMAEGGPTANNDVVFHGSTRGAPRRIRARY